jgi:hypothetical protein
MDGQYRPQRQRPQDRPLPRFVTTLTPICGNTDAHPLPCKMIFISESMSDKGQRMAIYACAHDDCAWREGWVQDRHNSSKAFRLFGRFHHR